MITNIDSISVQIKEQYALAEENFNKAKEYQSKALFYAKNCGELLIEAKKQCPHGTWLNWLETNTPIPSRTAQRYMSFALNWDVIEVEITGSDNPSFGINDAQKLLTAQKKNATMADLDQTPKSKNATMADLTKKDFKAFIFDSIKRQKDLEKQYDKQITEIKEKYKSLDNFQKLLKSLDDGENIKSNDNETIDIFTDKEKFDLHTNSIKLNMLITKYREEEMRQVWLESKIDLDLDPKIWEQWIELEFKFKPKMIEEFITTDKSLFFDLLHEYYSDDEFIEKIKEMYSQKA